METPRSKLPLLLFFLVQALISSNSPSEPGLSCLFSRAFLGSTWFLPQPALHIFFLQEAFMASVHALRSWSRFLLYFEHFHGGEQSSSATRTLLRRGRDCSATQVYT
jgi:hypothetical protein